MGENSEHSILKQYLLSMAFSGFAS